MVGGEEDGCGEVDTPTMAIGRVGGEVKCLLGSERVVHD